MSSGFWAAKCSGHNLTIMLPFNTGGSMCGNHGALVAVQDYYGGFLAVDHVLLLESVIIKVLSAGHIWHLANKMVLVYGRQVH